jgi:hypothetical protein
MKRLSSNLLAAGMLAGFGPAPMVEEPLRIRWSEDEDPTTWGSRNQIPVAKTATDKRGKVKAARKQRLRQL